MGIWQFLRECEVTTDGYAAMAADSIARMPMASRAKKHIQLRFLYVQDLVASGVARLRKVDANHGLPYLHTKLPGPDRIRYLSELHHLRPISDHYRVQSILDYNSHKQLVRHDASCIACLSYEYFEYHTHYNMQCFVFH